MLLHVPLHPHVFFKLGIKSWNDAPGMWIAIKKAECRELPDSAILRVDQECIRARMWAIENLVPPLELLNRTRLYRRHVLVNRRSLRGLTRRSWRSRGLLSEKHSHDEEPLYRRKQFHADSFFFSLSHLARTAFWAIALRSSGVKFFRLFFPPLRPSFTAAGFFFGISSAVYIAV